MEANATKQISKEELLNFLSLKYHPKKEMTYREKIEEIIYLAYVIRGKYKNTIALSPKEPHIIIVQGEKNNISIAIREDNKLHCSYCSIEEIEDIVLRFI